jgi:hypothetical protein
MDGMTEMAETFSTLETKILLAKGVSQAQLEALEASGVTGKSDFATIGDAATLRQLLGDLDAAVAADVMAWATGVTSTAGGSAPPAFVVESADVVYCVHCKTKQPKDYKSGDLCTSCGKQAEPILSCFWCTSSGPGTYCRQCGAEFVATADLDLALLLKREGVPKDAIATQLKTMSQPDKDVLWGRVRKSRG